jgi:hypothetical protein
MQEVKNGQGNLKPMKYLPIALAATLGCAQSNNMGNLSTLASFNLSCHNLTYVVLNRSQGIPDKVGVVGCGQKTIFKRRLHQRFGVRITRKATWEQENPPTAVPAAGLESEVDLEPFED